jgi:hypothetical protein
MAEESCACYFSRVTREYVRSSGHSPDDSPSSHHNRQTASETLSEVARAVQFCVEDGIGRADAQKVVDHFGPSASPGVTLGGVTRPSGRGRRDTNAPSGRHI